MYFRGLVTISLPLLPSRQVNMANTVAKRIPLLFGTHHSKSNLVPRTFTLTRLLQVQFKGSKVSKITAALLDRKSFQELVYIQSRMVTLIAARTDLLTKTNICNTYNVVLYQIILSWLIETRVSVLR